MPPWIARLWDWLLKAYPSDFRLEFWNRDSQDSFVESAAELRHHFAQSPPADGDILLFHDDYRITTEPPALRHFTARFEPVR